ncbi:endonuclease/exonuclease/phosphatase family protein [Nocardia higoensis]|uniref:Endonuclease/exonuclease/phosphatase family protein n=1 Tax=Nocardia higoensis TaxID=228599 RepID=A0ABS0D9C5_9NOCA|nr:endonuclease/exonuclease/phosphatase family protein [Nocardia higoensis]MBF6353474.1 endonuclease/exonuclease/phosphatase family protein [Nocardia higoensis]
MITVATWNVLHRIHADNWGEEAPRQWPDEAARITAVTEWIAGRTEQIIALQEVSGDLLNSLRIALPDRTVLFFRYPRVPTPRRVAAELTEPAEYLALILDKPAKEIAADAFRDDPGKGILAVQVGELTVVATHLSGAGRNRGQLDRLARFARDHSGSPMVILGDFNTSRETVATHLTEFTIAEFPDSAPPTRPRPMPHRSRDIDHIVVRGLTVVDADVDNSGDRSDHNYVHATVTRDATP